LDFDGADTGFGRWVWFGILNIESGWWEFN